MASELKLRSEQSGGIVNIFIGGEVDIYTSQGLKEKLYDIVDTNKMDIRFDCKDLNYIDSTGLGIFVGTLKRTKQYDKKVYITNLKESIKKLFIITGLDKVFIMNEDV